MKGFLFYFAKRYIAGTERVHAVEAVKKLNADRLLAAIDLLGENVSSPEEADAPVKEYKRLLNDIKASGARSVVSLKLTHLGLDISTELAEQNLCEILQEAEKLKNFVWLDMECSRYTEDTLDIFLKMHQRYRNLGVAIQSYLLRSADDIKTLIDKGASVRLVKGAYKEPPGVAFQAKALVDRNFSELMKTLLLDGVRPAIATHDEKLINEAKKFADDNNISKDRFEFQMLLGIKRSLQKRLAAEGYNVRVYVPYGRNWLPYIIRRLRERRENIFFVARNIID